MGLGGELIVESREDESKAVSMRQPRKSIAARKNSGVVQRASRWGL